MEDVAKTLKDQDDVFDVKGKLQHLAQEKFQITPRYGVLKVDANPKRDYLKFMVGVFLNESLIGEGYGSNKHKAGIKAAENTLKLTKNLTIISLSLLRKRDITKEILY